MQTVILCGGLGTRLREETEFRPKPMVNIGAKPILWHIMKIYAACGYTKFILALGYKGEMIRDFFCHYELMNCDITLELGSPEKIQLHNQHDELGWKITLAHTGATALKGARLKKIEKYIEGDDFMVTYGDGVANVDISKLIDFHKSHGKIGTISGVHPPSQYGELMIKKDQVLSFNEKKERQNNSINGGYFVFNTDFFRYLEDDDNCILERAPLEKLTLDGELKAFHHKGFWQCMDTNRDYKYLMELWKSSRAPWKIW